MNEYLLTSAVLCTHQYSNISCFQMVIIWHFWQILWRSKLWHVNIQKTNLCELMSHKFLNKINIIITYRFISTCTKTEIIQWSVKWEGREGSKWILLILKYVTNSLAIVCTIWFGTNKLQQCSKQSICLCGYLTDWEVTL